MNRSLVMLIVLRLASLVDLHAAEPIAIGSRHKLFVDRLLVGEVKNTSRKLHEPQPAEPPLKDARPHGHDATLFKVVQLRVELSDADLFSIRFVE